MSFSGIFAAYRRTVRPCTVSRWLPYHQSDRKAATKIVLQHIMKTVPRATPKRDKRRKRRLTPYTISWKTEPFDELAKTNLTIRFGINGGGWSGSAAAKPSRSSLKLPSYTPKGDFPNQELRRLAYNKVNRKKRLPLLRRQSHTLKASLCGHRLSPRRAKFS